MVFDIDKYGSRLAIIADDGRRLTYAELGELVAQRSHSLQRGVLQFCLCKNTIESSIIHHYINIEELTLILR